MSAYFQPQGAGDHLRDQRPGGHAVGAAGHPGDGLASGLPHHHEGAPRLREGEHQQYNHSSTLNVYTHQDCLVHCFVSLLCHHHSSLQGRLVHLIFIDPVVVLQAITLEGAGQGLLLYITPDWSKLYTSECWIDSATQIFFAYSIGTGALPALGSYNKFYHNCIKVVAKHFQVKDSS